MTVTDWNQIDSEHLLSSVLSAGDGALKAGDVMPDVALHSLLGNVLSLSLFANLGQLPVLIVAGSIS